MPASASYLTKYLNAGTTTNGNSNGTTSSPGDFEDSSRPKKRRKKDRHVSTTDTNTGTGALFIADDDEGLLLSATSKVRNEEDEDGPLVYSGNVKSVGFRKKKGSTWRAVGGAGGAGGQIQEQEQIQTQVGSTARVQQNEPGDRDREEDEATKILNAAAEESAQRNALINDEDAPTIVGEIITTEPKRPIMSSGAPAGLQTAEDTAALARLAAQSTDGDANGNSESATRKKRRPKDSKDAEPEPETIYRDATGRRIDVSLARSEARAAAAAKIAAEKKAREDAMGEVQLREREEQKRELEEARYLTVGRDVDDEEMNERLKGTVRWDDPMAGYMEEKRRDGRGKDGGTGEVNSDGDGGGVGRTTRRGRKEYAGAAAPNRYGIRPGWRWDGVDRGNGFEKEWFQARGKKTRNENLEYQWAYDE